MSRPLYETKSDLSRESEVADLIKQKNHGDCRKLPIKYGVDWAIMRDNQIAAFAELKSCRHDYGVLPRVMLSLDKWMKGKQLSDTVGVPFIIYVHYPDGVYWAKQHCCEVTFEINGRKDRGDWQDMEPVVLIKLSDFKRL